MKNKFYILTFTILILNLAFFTSCKEYDISDCEAYDYSDCNTWVPYWGILNIDVTLNNLNPKVPLVIYYDDFNSNDTAWVDTATSEFYQVYMPIGDYYSVVAKYKTSDKIIYAVDGDEITKKSEDVCDSVCWIVKDGRIDVRLKY
ncbi:MAG: hypothetical protein H8E98_04310 [Bacteroidetes bacterium]|nr:hypothetical protein [Bacteroidota bacterium]